MSRIGAWALSVGAPGLFVIAFLDSSVLSLPEVNDLLIVWMVTKHPTRLLLYALMATLGSLAGSLVMFYLGRKGGEAMMRRRFKEKPLRRAHELYEKYGLLAVAVPALLPPPVPLKLFVLLAGVVNMSVLSFSLALILGRGARYIIWGLLAIWYGEAAIGFLKANPRETALVAVLAAAAVGGVYYLSRRARRRNQVGS